MRHKRAEIEEEDRENMGGMWGLAGMSRCRGNQGGQQYDRGNLGLCGG